MYIDQQVEFVCQLLNLSKELWAVKVSDVSGKLTLVLIGNLLQNWSQLKSSENHYQQQECLKMFWKIKAFDAK